ncbi:MAG: radical SAM protein [Fibrobacter sp.]|jgi:radical SAM protein with 4Fe4S-binding SPASM domain|nr:radical SAM protein [Fibrobacter sp.]
MKNNKQPTIPMPTDVSVITTYRCQMRCKMCDIWKYPTQPKEEIKPEELEILPPLKFANVTGGEPFLRDDLEDIIEVLYKKAPRIVISTSGYWVEKTIKLAERFPNIGIRVSIEGLEKTNNFLRGREDGYVRGLRTLKSLYEMGIKDIGFGQTLSNYNSQDLIPLYDLSRTMNLEFATAAFHNSYYFHKQDNQISHKEELCENLGKLINRLLQEKHPKAWFRAFFNLGLINYIQGNKRLLPCEAGTVNFFIDPFGEVYPCNGLEKRYWQESMGNIRSGKTFEEIWLSEQAAKVRNCVRSCPKNCWMVGTAAPVMKKYITKVAPWVLKAKAKSLLKKQIDYSCFPHFDVGQDPRQGDLREKINEDSDCQ